VQAPKLQGIPPDVQREHPALQNNKIFLSFYQFKAFLAPGSTTQNESTSGSKHCLPCTDPYRSKTRLWYYNRKRKIRISNPAL
jgi:hypothetical protein